jgi:hypothetical protein
MPRVAFTPQLQRFLDAPPRTVDGTTVAAALARVFEDNPRLGTYVLDDHGHVRPHVAVFVGGAHVKDRRITVESGDPPTLKQIWSLEAGGPDQPGRLWAGTLPGGLFSLWLPADGGDRWTTVSNHLPPVYPVRFGPTH